MPSLQHEKRLHKLISETRSLEVCKSVLQYKPEEIFEILYEKRDNRITPELKTFNATTELE